MEIKSFTASLTSRQADFLYRAIDLANDDLVSALRTRLLCETMTSERKKDIAKNRRYFFERNSNDY